MKVSGLRWVFVSLSLFLLAACGGGGSGGEEACGPGEICVTVTAGVATGPELRLLLYETTEEDWPQDYRNLPTPGWVVTEYPLFPASFPAFIRIPVEGNLMTIGGGEPEGSRMGLAIATGVASFITVAPTDSRGFSDSTLVCDTSAPMDFGSLELALPAGSTCELNPYHPQCLTGGFFWETHFLGEEDFVPGAVYMDVADLNGDGNEDIITVGEPHFEEPDLPLTELKMGAYYLSNDGSVISTEVIDAWSVSDQSFYSPWSVKVVDHGGDPMVVVGTNIPELAPLEEGYGNVFSYAMSGGDWVRSLIVDNHPDPTNTNYNAMIVVPCDIDNDGDDDIALSGAFNTSAVGAWLENTGQADPQWILHPQDMAPGTDPYIRGTLAYKCEDLNGDDYPEVIYNGMFDVPDTDPPRYRGEIWLAVNPAPSGTEGWDDPWEMIVIDDTNWASADMWFHDFDGDNWLDLVANQIFSSTVTLYSHPGSNMGGTWEQEVIIDDLTSPSDMWLADMDGDGLVDVVSADHTAHRGVWHKNPGTSGDPWWPNLIYENIRMPGDFTMTDFDDDGDLDWMGTSMTLGQAFIVEQVQPDSGLVLTVSLPDGFSADITRLVVTLANSLPVTGIPAAVLAVIDNVDADGDTELDVDQILSPGHDLVLALDLLDTPYGPVSPGTYHIVVGVYVVGGGDFQPVDGVDYLGASGPMALVSGKAEASIEVQLYSAPPP